MARGEDPWQRIEMLRERCPGIPLRAAISLLTEHGRRGADVISTEIASLWMRELVDRGVSQVVLIEPMMDIDRIAPVLKGAKTLGLVAVAALPLTQSVVRTDDELRRQASALVSAGAPK